MSNGFIIPTETNNAIVKLLRDASVPAPTEADLEKLHQQWLQFKKMKEDGNAPQTAAGMCAFLFGKEDDDVCDDG